MATITELQFVTLYCAVVASEKVKNETVSSENHSVCCKWTIGYIDAVLYVTEA